MVASFFFSLKTEGQSWVLLAVSFLLTFALGRWCVTLCHHLRTSQCRSIPGSGSFRVSMLPAQGVDHGTPWCTGSPGSVGGCHSWMQVGTVQSQQQILTNPGRLDVAGARNGDEEHHARMGYAGRSGLLPTSMFHVGLVRSPQ